MQNANKMPLTPENIKRELAQEVNLGEYENLHAWLPAKSPVDITGKPISGAKIKPENHSLSVK